MNFNNCIRSLAATLAICFFPICSFAQILNATNSLTDELLDVTEHRLKTVGPDDEVAQFISMEGEAVWARHETFFALTRNYLDDTNAIKVAGAIDVLYRLRGFQPMEWIGSTTFKEVNSNYFANLDTAIQEHFSYFMSLHNDDVYKRLSLYLGYVPSTQSRLLLKKIIESTKNNEQSLICLCWQHEATDMDFLLPYMLADNPASSSLPYHFRTSYGKAAIPYLQRAISDAKNGATREQAQKELQILEK